MKSFVKNLIKLVCFALVLMPAILFCGCEVEQKTNNSGMRRAEVTSEETANAESSEIADDFDDEFEDFEDEGPLYNITVDPSSNTSIIRVFPERFKAYKGDIVHVSYTINENFVVDKITANGVAISYGYFIVGEEDVVVKAFIKPKNEVVVQNKEFTIKTVSYWYASLSTDKQTADANEIVTISCELDSQYELKYFTVNGNRLDDVSFVMPAEDVEIYAICSKKQTSSNSGSGDVGIPFDPNWLEDYDSWENDVGQYEITAEKTSAVEIIPSRRKADPGQEIIIYCKISDGFTIVNYYVNGKIINGNKFIMPDRDVYISCAIFDGYDTMVSWDTFWGDLWDPYEDDDDESNEQEDFFDSTPIENNSGDNLINDNEIPSIDSQSEENTSGYSSDQYDNVISFPVEWLMNDIIVHNYAYITINTDKTKAFVGEIVNISYEIDDDYELKYFTVNGNRIDGTTFTMPNKDAEIYAVCSKKSTNSNEASIGASASDNEVEFDVSEWLVDNYVDDDLYEW